MRTTQKSEAAFADSSYSLPEDATTPNMRSATNSRCECSRQGLGRGSARARAIATAGLPC